MFRAHDGSPTLFALPEGPDYALENSAIKNGASRVAGLDEAGRGPLAGPVVAAAVILDCDAIPEGLNDSKALSAARRNALFDVILESAHVSIASSGPALIDRIDIRKASLDAMRRALAGLDVSADHALVDGRDCPPGFDCPGEPIIKGDARSVSIAAASIVAKVMRDRMMARLSDTYPEYGFALHAGYATQRHRDAIAVLGPCPLHRFSFRPIRTEPAAP